MKKTLTTLVALAIGFNLYFCSTGMAGQKNRGRSFAQSGRKMAAGRSQSRPSLPRSSVAGSKRAKHVANGTMAKKLPGKSAVPQTKKQSYKPGIYQPSNPSKVKPGVNKPGAKPNPLTQSSLHPGVKPNLGQPQSALPQLLPKPLIKPLPNPLPNWKPKPYPNPNPQLYLPLQQWCLGRPLYCHWWYRWCPCIRVCRTADCVVYDIGRVVIDDCSWYLGITGIVLPGKGLGIENVDVGSPAELAGLKPGMAISSINGIELVDDTSIANAIATSAGVLDMKVKIDDTQELVNLRVSLRRLTLKRY